MDFKNQDSAGVQGNATANQAANNAVQNDTAKTATTSKTNGKAEPDKGKVPNTNPAIGQDGPAKNEQTPLAKETVMPIKLALNLESTLKVVEDLHRRSIQRVNLIARIKQLEAFEVSLATENDELEENPYQGCKLIIEDDKARRFLTTTPGLIRMAAQFIFDACSEKLAGIEATIVLPQA